MRNEIRTSELMIVVGALFVTIQGIILFAFRITPLIAFGSLVAACSMAIAIFQRRKAIGLENQSSKDTGYRTDVWIFATATLIGDIAIIYLAWLSRTDEALRSPWEALTLVTVVIYLMSTWTLLLHRRETNGLTADTLLVLHCFTAWGIAESVYALGFGFDPFIHRTAETHIVAQGMISPRQPFYNGQYAAVIGLHWLTRLPLEAIDRWLVPSLAALTVPVAVRRFGLWGVAILAIPLLPFTFTTPSNLATVFLLLAVLTETPIAPIVAAASFVAHPLIGTPALLLVAAKYALRNGSTQRLTTSLTVLAAAIVTPAMLVLHNIRQGAPAFASGSPLSRLDFVIGLYLSPFRPFKAGPIDGWDFLYSWHAMLPFIMAVFAAIGARHLWKAGKRTEVLAPIAVITGTIMATAIMVSAINVPGIIAHEQSEFALRLTHLMSLIVAPLFIVGLSATFPRMISSPINVRIALSMLACAAMISAAWILSYPQSSKNAADFTGRGICRTDFDVVASITRHAAGRNYIVLSNQMTSVAALSVLGFNNLPYALPTGSARYEQYINMAYWRTERTTMTSTMAEGNAEIGYFVAHGEEPDFERMRSTAEVVADESWEVGGGRAWVFVFYSDTYYD